MLDIPLQVSSFFLFTVLQNMRQNTGIPTICRNKKHGWAQCDTSTLTSGFKNRFIAKALSFLKTWISKSVVEQRFKEIPEICDFLSKNAFLPNQFELLFFSLKCSLIIPKKYTENRFQIRKCINEIQPFKILLHECFAWE